MAYFKKFILYLIFAFFVFLTLFLPKVYGDDWVIVNKTDDYTINFNKTNIDINRKSKQIKVWIKFTYTEKGKDNIINNRKNNGLQLTNYDNLSYSFNLYLFNYNKNNYMMLSSDDYTMSGDTLDSFNNSIMKWDNITPDGIFDIILIKILKEYKINR